MPSRLGAGIERGRTGGGFGAFFQTLSSELTKAKERREKEDIQRRKEEAALEMAIQTATQKAQDQEALERLKTQFKREETEEEIKLRGEEERITKREFPPAGPKPAKITSADIGTLSAIETVEEERRPMGWLSDVLTPWPTAYEKAQKEVGGISPEIRGQFKKQFLPAGANKIRVRVISSGQTGTIEESEFDPKIYERL